MFEHRVKNIQTLSILIISSLYPSTTELQNRSDRVLCLDLFCFVLVWQSVLSSLFYTSLAETSCQTPGPGLDQPGLDLANLVTNLAKQSLGQPSHQPDQT